MRKKASYRRGQRHERMRSPSNPTAVALGVDVAVVT
jgi:hypothetical protein